MASTYGSVSDLATAVDAIALDAASKPPNAPKDAPKEVRGVRGLGGPALGGPAAHSLAVETKNRFTMFPVEYEDVYQAFKLQEGMLWTVQEVSLQEDVIQWQSTDAKVGLTENERFFISHILAFFAASDGIVIENLARRFIVDIPKAEFRAFYAAQMLIETVHSEMYSVLIDTYITDRAEKERLFNAVDSFPAIKLKAEWAIRFIDYDDVTDVLSLGRRIVAFAIVEGVFFSGAFCSIFWLRERGKMPGLCASNDLISRDEASHTLFGVLAYSKMQPHERLPAADIARMMREAVDIEVEFINEALPCAMLGMNADAMATYIRFVADRLLVQLGYERVFNVEQPFDFMERTALSGKSNFFEKRDTDYSRPSFSASTEIAVNSDINF